MAYSQISTKLKQLRTEKGLTQAQTAQHIIARRHGNFSNWRIVFINKKLIQFHIWILCNKKRKNQFIRAM